MPLRVSKMNPKIDELDRMIDEQRKREKDIDQRKVIDSVFDQKTSLLLLKLQNKGVIRDLGQIISTGKEANVYFAKNQDKKEFAVKVYRTTTTEFRNNWRYVQGDPRFKKYKKGTYSFIYTWAKKEYKNLQRLKSLGVSVPEPIAVQENILIMEFIGKDGEAAPLLRDAEIKHPEKVYKIIVEYLTNMYQKGQIVHADLSEYNILYHKKKPVIIDVSQSVLLDHPNALGFLFRDIKNVNRYFSGFGIEIITDNELYEQITNNKYDPKLSLFELK